MILLKLQSGKSYTLLFASLKFKKVVLSPPKNPRKTGKAANKSATGTQSQVAQESTTENESTPCRLPQPHVPPICAPDQASVI